MTLIDLFSGCGGFSLGAHQAGFQVAAAFDHDPILSSSYALNYTNTQVMRRDVSELSGDAIKTIVPEPIQGVFGGPPCQAFSAIGKRQSTDPRRLLVWHFYRIVKELQPNFFIMENVRGLGFPESIGILNEALSQVKDEYSILGPHVWNAADFGAATQRQRLFVIGIHKSCGTSLAFEDIEALKKPPSTVQSALADLSAALAVGEEDGFDLWRITKRGRPSTYARSLRAQNGQFTGQRSTDHSAEVKRRFDKVPPGAVDPIGRHYRLAWSGQCPTLRAGTGSDRGSYQSVRPIHPEEPRVITVREAARLQGFPDQHRFHPTVWHSFRMIGNSVSPIIAKAMFSAISTKLGSGPSQANVAS
jgi:DNA (cytosine-5)-methyltransferase 1